MIPETIIIIIINYFDLKSILYGYLPKSIYIFAMLHVKSWIITLKYSDITVILNINI